MSVEIDITCNHCGYSNMDASDEIYCVDCYDALKDKVEELEQDLAEANAEIDTLTQK